MKHTKFKINKLTTAACTKHSRKRQDFKNSPTCPFRVVYTGANGNEAHQIQNKQVDDSSLYQTQPKTTRLQKRVSCGVVLMASTMLHEKCCNTALQIGAPQFFRCPTHFPHDCSYVIGSVVVVVFFTLTDRASTIPSNTRGCQSGTWSAGQKNIRGTSTKLQREQRKAQTHKRQRDRNRNNKIHRPEKDKRAAFDRESLA